MKESEKILIVDISLLVPNKYQPRKTFNESSLEELSASIKTYGILNPILVRPSNDKYEIIAGERRYRAAKMAGFKQVPVIVKNVDENKLAEIALIENLQRENISPIEEAESYEQILKLSSMTEQELSQIVGKSQSFISNKLRLLKLPNNIKEALSQRKISERHARSLMTIDEEAKQTELLNRIINEKLTVKELDNIINEKQITADEINKAISDIMKTLEINEEEKQKEEKESDNMNNGNFFPNMNQNMPQGEQNASLNTMNMQTMGMSQMNTQQYMAPPMPPQPDPSVQMPMFNPSPVPEPVMKPEPVPDFSMPIKEPPLFANSEPKENFNFAPQTSAAPLQPDYNQPVDFNQAPDFNPVPDFNVTQPEQPLFNSEANFQTPVSEPAYEVPVMESAPQEFLNPQPDKLTMIKDFLNANNVNFKSYSNETGNCIIIEL